jgi:RNA polymerase sigma-70 factor, ECF subfamily
MRQLMITFHDLYQRYAADVYRFAFWLSGQAAEAEDITSETFIRAWTSRSQLQTETLKAYLLAIARNVYLKQQQKEARYGPLHDNYCDPQPSPEKIVGQRLALEEALAVLHQLPELDRTVFVLQVQHELPYAEIARVTGLSLAASKVKVHRVRLKLAAASAAEELDEER